MFDLSKNLNAMKKLLMFISLPFLAVSCMVDRGDEIHRTEESVTVYTAGLFYDFAYSSATMLDDALELDAYLKLTEQERLDPIYDGLRSRLKHYDENTFVLDDSKVFSVDGMSLTDEGSIWTIKIENGYDYMYNRYECYKDDGAIIVWTITCTGTDSWEVKSGDESAVELDASYTRTRADIPDDYAYRGSGYDYQASLSGSVVEDSSGMSGIFSADDFRYFYDESESDWWEGMENAPAGLYVRTFTVTFRLDMYKWGVPRDWCIQYTTADGTDYLTSVDSNLPLD